MKRNPKSRKENNDLVPILLIGGAVVLYFYLTRKKAIITVGPMSDPVWNAPENYTPTLPEDDRWLSSKPGGKPEFDYYQEIQGDMISGNPRRRKRGFGLTC